MAGLTPQQHANDRAMAEELIAEGLVTTWKQLGAAFEISAQAANARFGKQYGLRMPKRPRQFRRMVSVSLDQEMDTALETIRKRLEAPGMETPSRAHIVRELLRDHLLSLQGEARDVVAA